MKEDKNKRKIDYGMGEEKIAQNIERVYIFIFQTLGCCLEDAKKIIDGVIKKREKIDIERKSKYLDKA